MGFIVLASLHWQQARRRTGRLLRQLGVASVLSPSYLRPFMKESELQLYLECLSVIDEADGVKTFLDAMAVMAEDHTMFMSFQPCAAACYFN